MIKLTYNQKLRIQYKMRNPFTSNTNARVNARLAGNTGTKQNNFGINKVLKTNQNITNSTRSYMSMNNGAIEPRKKNQGPKTTKEIILINVVIVK